MEIRNLLTSKSFFFNFTELCFLEFLISNLPIFSELLLLQLLHVFFYLLSLHLHFSTLLYRTFHFSSSLFLHRKQLCSFLLCFLDLLVKNSLCMIFSVHQVFYLSVNKLLSFSLFFMEFLRLFVFS